jgi:hypothetical protein
VGFFSAFHSLICNSFSAKGFWVTRPPPRGGVDEKQVVRAIVSINGRVDAVLAAVRSNRESAS